MTKAKLKEWLKLNNMTEEKMDEIWAKLVEINHATISLLDKNGINWRKMESYQLDQLPTLYEKTLDEREKKRIKEENRVKEEEHNKNCAHYYEEHFEEIMLEKYDTKTPFTECEIERMLEYELEEYRRDCEEKRWTKFVTSIVSIGNRYFSIHWEKALTEMGVSCFDYQPVEVFKSTKFEVREYDVFITDRNRVELANEKFTHVLEKYENRKSKNGLEKELIEVLHNNTNCSIGACEIAFSKAKELCKLDDYRTMCRLAMVLLDCACDVLDYEC